MGTPAPSVGRSHLLLGVSAQMHGELDVMGERRVVQGRNGLGAF